MKKFLSLLAAATLCAACLVGCGDSSSKTDGSSFNSTSSSPTAQTNSDNGSDKTDDTRFSASITIDVSDIVANYDTLDKGLQSEEFVPKSGKLIDSKSCEFTQGQTAYDLLIKAAEENNIKLETQSSEYGVYIYAINSIPQGACGQSSGWMFSVNGTTPEVGADAYELKSGDKVEFFFVCDFNKMFASRDSEQQAA